MAEFEYTPLEDARYDHLVDVQNKDAHEARSIIELERQESERRQRREDNTRLLGVDAAARFIKAPVATDEVFDGSKQEAQTNAASKSTLPTRRKIPHYGGKIRDADSALDPNWNVATIHDPAFDTPENTEAREKFISEAHEDTIRALVRSGLSQIEAEARMKAHQEIKQRY